MKTLLPSLKVSTALIFIISVGLFFSPPVFGGALIIFDVTDLEAPPGENKGVGQLSADTKNSLLKFENDMNNPEERGTMVFNQNKQVLEFYDHQSHEKYVMDKNTARQMKQQMQGHQSQFDDMMKNMTDEQKAMMQQMGRGTPPPTNRQGGSGPEDLKIVKTSKRQKVLRLPCTVYEAYAAGRDKQFDLCVTDVSNIPDGKAVKQLMGGLSGFYRNFISSMSMGGETDRDPFEIFNKVDGFPLKTTRYEGGRPVEITTMTSIKKAGFNPEDFNPFPDYPAVGMMEGRGTMREMPQRPEGMDDALPGDSMSPPPGYPIPGQTPGQPMDLQKLLEGLQQRR